MDNIRICEYASAIISLAEKMGCWYHVEQQDWIDWLQWPSRRGLVRTLEVGLSGGRRAVELGKEKRKREEKALEDQNNGRDGIKRETERVVDRLDDSAGNKDKQHT